MDRRPRRKMENRLETKQMKLTTKLLKQMIAEEMNNKVPLKEGAYAEGYDEFQNLVQEYGITRKDFLDLADMLFPCVEEPQLSEGMENITPENLQLVLDAVVKMAGVFGPAIMAAIPASALYQQIMGRKAEIDQEAELDEKKDPEAKVRNRGDVLFSAESPSVNDDEDHFPINTEKQARSALSRANQYSSAPPWYNGTLEALVKKVASAVEEEWPSINVSPASSKPGKG